MSVVNFAASAQHHAEILINIEVIGNIQGQELELVLNKIQSHTKVAIADAGRVVFFRFKQNVLVENCQWGTFQPHRRAMGFICIAGCATAMDVALMHQKFQKSKQAYADYIYDSRCFIFGNDHSMLQQSKAEVYQFANAAAWVTSDRDVKDFLTSVFYVLESKRVHVASDKSDRPPLLTAVFEGSSSSSSDNDSRNNRKKQFGRWRKHLADISLLAGLPLEALQNYRIAIEALTVINDQAWLGGALEGLSVTSAIVLYPEGNSLPSFEQQDERLNKQKQTLDPRNLLSPGTSSTFSDLHKFCIQKPDELVDKYKEAVICYTRCRELAIVEVEACIKATKILAIFNKPLKAAEFIQNAIYIGLEITHAERITKYDCMANLYDKINFHRKSSFYKRIAAMQCVAPNLDHADWFGCNLLLQGTLVGSKLNLATDMGKPSDQDAPTNSGWPQIQLRILHELIFASRKIGDNQMANRYSVYLLMNMHKYLSAAEIKEYCVNLEASSSKITQANETELLQLQDGTILPSLHLYSLPVVNDAKPQPLALPLQPTKLQASKGHESIFLFSPFTQNSANSSSDEIDFQWCVNTMANALVTITNPLPSHYLRLSQLKLICEVKSKDKSPQKDFECQAVSMDIPPSSTLSVKLPITPLKPGLIQIKGYEFTLFGVRSRCLFCLIPWLKFDKFEVEVTPELPFIQNGSDFLSTAKPIKINLFQGEIQTLEVPLVRDETEKELVVDFMDVTSSVTNPTFSLPSKKAPDSPNWLTIACREPELPLSPEGQKCLFVTMTATSEPIEEKEIGGRSNEKDYLRFSDARVKVKYSCGRAAKENWGREMDVDLSVKLHTGLLVEGVTVKPFKSQGFCNVSIEVTNYSKKTFVLSYDDYTTVTKATKTDIWEPNEKKKVSTQIATIDFANCSPGLKDKSLSLDASHSAMQTSGLQSLLDQQLNITWRIENSARHGRMSISSVPLSRDCLLNLIRPSLFWSMSIGGCDVTESKQWEAAIGEPCHLCVTIKNTSIDSIPIVNIDLETFQDQMNGFREWNMADCVLCTGAQSQQFENIEPGSSVVFEVMVVFLLRGRYHLRLCRTSSTIDESTAKLKTSSNSVENENFHNFSPSLLVTASQG